MESPFHSLSHSCTVSHIPLTQAYRQKYGLFPNPDGGIIRLIRCLEIVPRHLDHKIWKPAEIAVNSHD